MVFVSWTFDFFLLLAMLLFTFYKYSTRNFDYWKKRGVFYIKPIPLFGNFYDILTFKTTIAQGLRDLYRQTDEPYLGVFLFDKPVLILRSPELIEHVLIKDFAYFKNRSLACPQHNPLAGNYLLFQKYNEWRKTRNRLAPVFTSCKLKSMSSIGLDVCNELTEYIEKHSHSTIDAKNLSIKYTTEVVSRCFFGINAFCFQKDHSDIQGISKRLFEFSSRNAIIQGLHVFKPEWVDWFKLDFMKRQDQAYIVKAISEVVKVRKENKRNKAKCFDYIDVLIEVSDKYEKENSASNKTALTEVLSNAFQFFIAGTETTGALISFALYELAINPNIQSKVREEITHNLKEHGDISYDSIRGMEYLECCLLETMRKYVSLQIIDREATEDYKVPGTDLVIEKNTVVYVPFHAIHTDEKYFPNHTAYDPDRFLGKSLNNDMNFIPFGAGPRICIGDRFALIMSKLVLATILTSYELHATDKTPIPMVLETKCFVFQSKFGVPLKFKSLHKT